MNTRTNLGETPRSDLIQSLRYAAANGGGGLIYEAVERIEYLTTECDRLHDVEHADSVPVVQLRECPEFGSETCGAFRGIMVGVALSIAFVWAPLTFWAMTR